MKRSPRSYIPLNNNIKDITNTYIYIYIHINVVMCVYVYSRSMSASLYLYIIGLRTGIKHPVF